jgi:hypothetical protein
MNSRDRATVYRIHFLTHQGDEDTANDITPNCAVRNVRRGVKGEREQIAIDRGTEREIKGKQT